MLEIVTLPVLSDNYIYLIHDEESAQTAVVDPAVAEPVLTILKEKRWHLNFILNTHHHHDHIGGNLTLKKQTDCRIVGAESDRERIPGIDDGVSGGEHLYLGRHLIEVLATPGHTRSHLVYFFSEQQALFCGDTVFAMGCGRLFEGTPEQMWGSFQKISALPVETRLYCAHEYTQQNGRFAAAVEPGNVRLKTRLIEVDRLRRLRRPTLPTTLAEELATNPFFRLESEEIQKNIGVLSNDPVQVFARLRRLKDDF